MTTHHVLILGGTGEARAIAARLAGRANLRVTSSLAGRTADPARPAGEVRIGGFGGAEGLAAWLAEHAVDVLVDATHPFAARISASAEAAAAMAAVPLVVHERPAWQPVEGDRWRLAPDMEDAARLLGADPRKVFLAVGRQELAPFAARPQHRYVVRSVEPAGEGLPANAETILERGPFDEADEAALLRDRRIDVLVTKNSGGEATYAKLAAARALGLPVVMVHRPRPPVAGACANVDQVVAAVDHALARLAERGE